MISYPSTFKKCFIKGLWIFFCFAFLLLFTSQINVVLDKIFVKPLLAGFKNTWFNEIVLLLLCTWMSAWLSLFGEKAFLQKLASFSAVFYGVQLFQPKWHFQHMLIWPLLREWDIVILALVLPGCFSFFPKRNKSSNSINNDGFVEDLAIDSEEQDTFNRKKVAREIAERISLTNNHRSFAIGILGEYGSGKTSFINLIKRYIDRSKVELVEFNPWSTDGTPNIQKDFFDLLASRLYKLNPQISGLVLDYSRKLSRIDSSAEKIIRQIGFAGRLFKIGSYADDYRQINKLLEKSDKKIIVTIDDLDRLYKEEVVEVLRLIRNTGSFTNVFYLVAYERGYVEDAIKSMSPNVGSSYLDKIIQLEIPLPKREAEDLLQLLESLLKGFVSNSHIEIYHRHVVETGFGNQFKLGFETIFRQSRDVIKFINNFKMAYKFLGEEVLFENLFVLELLKFRFPLIYDRLFERRSDFIQKQHSRSKHEEYYELKTYQEEKEEMPVIGRTLKNEEYYKEDEIRLICGLLYHLFFKFNRSSKGKNSIIYPSCFERYFRYRLSARDISEKQFQIVWQNGLTSVKQFINQCLENDLPSELSNRIFQIKPKDQLEFEQKVESLFYLGSKIFEKNENKTFDVNAFTDLIWNYDNNIGKNFYKGNEHAYRVFMEGVFDRAEIPFVFPAEVIYNIKHYKKEIAIPKTSLIDTQVRYFSEHIAAKGLSADAVSMFFGIRNEFTKPVANKPDYVTQSWKFEPQVIPVIKRALATNDPFEFLKSSITHDMREKDRVLIISELLDIFDQPEELREIVETNNFVDPTIKADYLAFFDACKEVGFKNWVTYEFKTSLKPNWND